MNPHKAVGPMSVLACLMVLLASAAGQDKASPQAAAGKPREAAESLELWPWFQEFEKPEGDQARYADSLLPPSVLDKARLDLADLRLRDAAGREVPFTVRIRHPQDTRKPLTHKEVNRGKVAKDGSTTLTLDLGKDHGEHNTVEIATSGTDFRRTVKVEGSDSSDKDWVVLLEQARVMHIKAEAKVIDVRRLSYPQSRFRYLRLHVFPDQSLDKDTPEITNVAVLWFTQAPGLDVTLPAQLGARQADRVDGRPSSVWTVEFGGSSVPCSQLICDVDDDDFVRSYQVEVVSPNEPNRVIAQGEWRRRAGEEKKPLEIRFEAEVTAAQLRLVLADYNNPPLTLAGVRYRAAARQLVVEDSDDLVWPLQLYFGNPKADAANYDFGRFVPETPAPPPTRAEWTAADAQPNPIYAPEPKPWTERWPWLVHVMLGAASLVLLAILGLLGRQALAKSDVAKTSA